MAATDSMRSACNSLSPRIGAAYSDALPGFLRDHQLALDYVEVPFELLQHNPRVVEVREQLPILLHCATLSIAGTVRCSEENIQQIQHWAEQTKTPWIGEHLAFVTADRFEAGEFAEEYAPGEPYNIGYTVSPAMNELSIDCVTENLKTYQGRFSVPLLIENSPLYFRMPGSSMSQAEFIRRVCNATGVGLLLDIAHWYISSRNMGFDPFSELDKLPLERVVEVHISGVDEQTNGVWDNHAKAAPEIVHQLLAQAMKRACPRAITLEYNWSARFPEDTLLKELENIRQAACNTGMAAR
jgi:uncharacterized protein